MNTYEFKAIILEEEREHHFFQGYTTASSYTQAIFQLTEYFDEDDIVELQVKYVNEIPLLLVSDGTSLEAITKENI